MPHLSSLEAVGLACVRGGRLVFEGIDFSVQAGRALVVEGPNGAGKTSLLRMLAGLLSPAAGTIRIDGRESLDREARGRLCGWLGHSDGVKAQFTIAENARFFAALYGGRESIEAALDRVGLTRLKDAPTQLLSAGQRRRLALSRLLIAPRPLWLLDEPFAALDVTGRALMRELIQSHCAHGGIAIAATHEPLGIDAAHLPLASASEREHAGAAL